MASNVPQVPVFLFDCYLDENHHFIIRNLSLRKFANSLVRCCWEIGAIAEPMGERQEGPFLQLNLSGSGK